MLNDFNIIFMDIKNILKKLFKNILLACFYVLIIGFTLTYGFEIYQTYFHKNALNVKDNKDLIDIFNTLLAFSGIIGFGVYKIISISISEQVEKRQKKKG